jgi:hypothetical protein
LDIETEPDHRRKDDASNAERIPRRINAGLRHALELPFTAGKQNNTKIDDGNEHDVSSAELLNYESGWSITGQ